MSSFRWKTALIILFGLAAGFTAWHFTICDGTSLAAIRARRISQERFAQIYQQMLELRGRPNPSSLDAERFAYWSNGPKYPIPSGFEDIRPVLIRPYANPPIVRLKGCMDHHLDLVLRGVDAPDEPPAIDLRSGEFAEEIERLWPETR